MWRPNNWQNGWDTEREEDGMYSKAEIFEAGADAMLETLRKQGGRVDIDCFPCNCYVPHLVIIPAHGYTVFISDEEVNNGR